MKHYGDSRRTASKLHESFQDVLCCRDQAERVVASFAHQVQSEYYGVNRFMFIEGISLEHFNALPQTEIYSSTNACPRNVVFNYLLPDNRKQDAATTTAHIKRFIELLKTFTDVKIK